MSTLPAAGARDDQQQASAKFCQALLASRRTMLARRSTLVCPAATTCAGACSTAAAVGSSPGSACGIGATGGACTALLSGTEAADGVAGGGAGAAGACCSAAACLRHKKISQDTGLTQDACSASATVSVQGAAASRLNRATIRYTEGFTQPMWCD